MRSAFASLLHDDACLPYRGCAMRLTILALIFCAGTTALCQSASPAPASPDNAQRTPSTFIGAVAAFTPLPPVWHRSSVLHQRMIVLPNGGPLRLNERAKIDP